jgi:hypothetical protein
MATNTSIPAPSLGDRYAEISVAVLTVIALLAGWFYKSAVENRSIPFESKGISAQAPSGWLQVTPKGDEVLHVIDISSNGFGTTYLVRDIPIAADTTASQMASQLSLEHGQNLTAFRVLDQREVLVYGRTAYEVSYAYVESNPDMTHAELPSVVRGMDYIFIKGDRATVATFWAEEKNFDIDLARFLRFLESLKF